MMAMTMVMTGAEAMAEEEVMQVAEVPEVAEALKVAKAMAEVEAMGAAPVEAGKVNRQLAIRPLITDQLAKTAKTNVLQAPEEELGQMINC